MQMGWPVLDTNEKYKDAGFDHIPLTRKNGVRTGIKEMLNKARYDAEEKLIVRKFAKVVKILFNPNKSDTVETIGVEYEQFGEICQVYAKYETVISAGAVGSPKLLMLSGIGPKNHLSKLKIPVKLDLPVGDNLLDHVVSIFGPYVIKSPLTFHPIQDFSLATLLKYLKDGAGFLSTTRYHGVGYVTVGNTSVSPNIQFIPSAVSIPDAHVAGLCETRCNTKPGLLRDY
ncbi:oxygen-dependent choline dehydrogenase [Folsomia candida]|uniref:oxygen-dependent choline dehydrogenase n=1 Tax=Folsomia candida TaxID=158441 RepID=UPI001604B84C|nr:oxygen-dependent choline dehydrogenase [Folsomia candida]